MANPETISLTADTWEMVARNVTSGQVKKLDTRPNMYLETYRMTGDDGPIDLSEGVPCFIGRYNEEISAAAGIDVYMMAVGHNGKVRVDI
jgi:hypothetical protein